MTPLLLNPDTPLALRPTARARCVTEAISSRELARGLLRSLIRAKAECEQQLARSQRSDLMETVRGSSSFDTAIEETRHMIESLDRAVEGFERSGR